MVVGASLFREARFLPLSRYLCHFLRAQWAGLAVPNAQLFMLFDNPVVCRTGHNIASLSGPVEHLKIFGTRGRPICRAVAALDAHPSKLSLPHADELLDGAA